MSKYNYVVTAHKPTSFMHRQFHWSTRTQSYYRGSFPLCILGFTSYISLKFLVVWITFFKPIVLRITFRFQIINIWLMLIMISSPLNLQAGYSSPTQSAIREDLNLPLAEYSLFGSILTFGLMIGAIASGPMADFFGRKGAPRISTAFCTAGWLAIYFAQGPLPLDIGRLATGFGMGVFSYVVPVFIAEIAPKN